MKLVTYQEFLEKCLFRLTDEQKKELRPYASYYLVDGAYVGLDFYEGLGAFFIWIAVGDGGGWWRALYKRFQEVGARDAYFCAPDGRGTRSFARYYKGEIEELGNGRLLCRVNIRSEHGRQRS